MVLFQQGLKENSYNTYKAPKITALAQVQIYCAKLQGRELLERPRHIWKLVLHELSLPTRAKMWNYELNGPWTIVSCTQNQLQVIKDLHDIGFTTDILKNNFSSM